MMRNLRMPLVACLDAIRPEDGLHHFEVETYAWGVLPPELQRAHLSDGIAEEMEWVRSQAGSPGSS